MAHPKKPSRPITFKHTARIRVRRIEFEPLASVRLLDAAKLARAARVEIELGSFQSDCCGQHVRATIEKGMVTGLVVGPCADDKAGPPTPELARIVKDAARRVAPPGRPVKFPVPVADLLGDVAAFTVKTITCVEICIWGHCIVCCTTHIPGSPIVCGKKVVIVTQ